MFFTILLPQCSDYSRRPHELLAQLKSSILFEKNHNGSRPKVSLKILTIGHQYFRQFLKKPNAMEYLRMMPQGVKMMCERTDVLYVKVVSLHVLQATSVLSLTFLGLSWAGKDSSCGTTPAPSLTWPCTYSTGSLAGLWSKLRMASSHVIAQLAIKLRIVNIC